MDNDNNCSDDAPYAGEFFVDMRPATIFAVILAVVITIVVVIMFIEAVVWLIKYIPYTQRRVRMIWNLGIYPVFCCIMLMAIVIPRSSVLATLTAAVYFSMAIYQFLLLILDYCDGLNAMIEKMRNVKLKLASSPIACCCVCLPKIRVTRRRVFWIRLGVMQVCILRPVVLYIAAVLWTNGNYTPGKIAVDEAFIYLNTLSILSTFIAMYALGMLNTCAKEILTGYSLTPKFACIQIGLMVANIQPMIFGIIGSTDVLVCTPLFSAQAKSSWVNDYLVICEMFILFLVAHHYYRREKGNIDTYRKFRAESFRTDYSTI
ncbi:organic solute transporter subunit alpha-like [Ptychodera flava]|uniref:organic solute transporter subunit alpha-like n=1 Tax=Ptychodera flava TaxID=63121 RepID=UPI00396A0C39